MKAIVKWFVQGLVILAPILITLWVAYEVFLWIDSLIPAKVPGMGFMITLVSITLFGLLASTILGRVFHYLEGLFAKLPLLKILYNALRDLMEAFAGDQRKFDQPVLVRPMPGSEIRLVGFITQKDLAHLGIEGMVSVYCPHSYNFSGQLIIVPGNAVSSLRAESSTVMSFIVSGGVSGGPSAKYNGPAGSAN